ncbi:single-stranded DNA-binding protein [Flavihumibacter petaseus]|uniref:Single-stranded DNA-binding protein n=1 Tax=Flavihumibacter petaseus NBRC 106054 TaxID=1220578 RepID=A0A0E9MUR3_9BACT|nr:single-stranded DNA-binding protein [Flavihumibacter petaseus]GAO41233.1 single-stranded DNA-binding protein [Flavihumibacter petaseus NBRC 106054]
MIKLQVIGNLGRDCVTNNVNGKTVMNFTVAHTERFRDASGNQQERTIWVDCAYWSDRTAVAQYLKKGTQVYVEGNPEVRTYAKNDGSTGASLTMRVQNVQLLGARQEGGNAGGGYQGGNSGGGYQGGNAGGGYQGGNFQGGGNSFGSSAPVSIDPAADDLPF